MGKAIGMAHDAGNAVAEVNRTDDLKIEAAGARRQGTRNLVVNTTRVARPGAGSDQASRFRAARKSGTPPNQSERIPRADSRILGAPSSASW
jgi:hypothetical protein